MIRGHLCQHVFTISSVDCSKETVDGDVSGSPGLTRTHSAADIFLNKNFKYRFSVQTKNPLTSVALVWLQKCQKQTLHNVKK